jgi:hypothetical protein
MGFLARLCVDQRICFAWLPLGRGDGGQQRHHRSGQHIAAGAACLQPDGHRLRPDKPLIELYFRRAVTVRSGPNDFSATSGPLPLKSGRAQTNNHNWLRYLGVYQRVL